MTTPTLPAKSVLMAYALSMAESYVGEGRDSDPAEIARFLALEGLPYSPTVPFCISGVAWCYAKALADLCGVPYTPETAVEVFKAQVKPLLATHYWYPSASCSDVVSHMEQNLPTRQMAWHDADGIGPDVSLPSGAVILYTWKPGEHHAEILKEDDGDTFATIGFNVTCPGHPEGGMIAGKTRKDIWPLVWGLLY